MHLEGSDVGGFDFNARFLENVSFENADEDKMMNYGES